MKFQFKLKEKFLHSWFYKALVEIICSTVNKTVTHHHLIQILAMKVFSVPRKFHNPWYHEATKLIQYGSGKIHKLTKRAPIDVWFMEDHFSRKFWRIIFSFLMFKIICWVFIQIQWYYPTLGLLLSYKWGFKLNLLIFHLFVEGLYEVGAFLDD